MAVAEHTLLHRVQSVGALLSPVSPPKLLVACSRQTGKAELDTVRNRDSHLPLIRTINSHSNVAPWRRSDEEDGVSGCHFREVAERQGGMKEKRREFNQGIEAWLPGSFPNCSRGPSPPLPGRLLYHLWTENSVALPSLSISKKEFG